MEPKRKTNIGKRKTKHITNREKHIIAMELPLRSRAANLGGVAARNEKLNALKAVALRHEIQCVDQMIKEVPTIQQALVIDVSQQLRKELAKFAKAGG